MSVGLTELLTQVRLPRAARGYFSKSQLTVQTLCRCPYNRRVQRHALRSVRTFEIPSLGWNTVLWTHENSSLVGILSPVNHKGLYQGKKKKNNFSLTPSYSAHKSSNHKLSQICQFSPNTDLCKTKLTYTNIKRKIFEELVPWVLPLLKKKKKIKQIRLGYAGIMDPSSIYQY